ncbi:hypothetical protein C8F04DRAFT_1182994 [Mycena alexandri]|uniref:Uncharacterized protein n=1 Tax=Mycena alexandri TaxID=1745969 RepID=A0AAD6SXQ2_9AGAR|nr:hypothetical protein C8F04DRAFT_1182981 [Mycena alexandri]KAJ7034724.1 hypothetical protein C8F04DRAFT_1182985 [Mycena alexandri]KAJ7034735.1 hypothetical protein C8F04DRAFT_1182994 [Mycena alexandri]
MEHYVLKRDVPAGGQKNLTKLERKSKEVQSENIHIVNIAGTPARCLRRPPTSQTRKEIDKKVEFEAIHVEDADTWANGRGEKGEMNAGCTEERAETLKAEESNGNVLYGVKAWFLNVLEFECCGWSLFCCTS